MAQFYKQLADRALDFWLARGAVLVIVVLQIAIVNDRSHSDGCLNLEWRESEGPTVSAPDHHGFGTRLLLRALEQFGGNVDATFAPTGLVCKLTVPISELSPSIVPPTGDAQKILAAKGG